MTMPKQVADQSDLWRCDMFSKLIAEYSWKLWGDGLNIEQRLLSTTDLGTSLFD